MSDGLMSNRSTSYRDCLQGNRFGVDRFDREVLLGHVIGRDRAWIWSHLDDPIAPVQLARLQELLRLRESGQPIAYLLGYREFYGRLFQVSPAVLIPRPETELLVELALGLLPEQGVRAIDVGTGSGAIGLTLAAERPGWAITASDLSSAALEVADINRHQLGLEGVELIQGDLLDGEAIPAVSLVISNPPYVAQDDPHLDSGDLRFEPRIALACGPDGLSLIRKLIEQAFRLLDPGGWILLEHGHDQAEAVRSLLRAEGFESVRSWTDLARIERVSGGHLPS